MCITIITITIAITVEKKLENKKRTEVGMVQVELLLLEGSRLLLQRRLQLQLVGGQHRSFVFFLLLVIMFLLLMLFCCCVPLAAAREKLKSSKLSRNAGSWLLTYGRGIIIRCTWCLPVVPVV